MAKETASEKVNIGPPLMPVNGCPRNANSTVTAVPSGPGPAWV
jgi:hypothetical protein